jgi:hypothetical protein
MLATFGLDRLEASLDGDTVSPADVTAFLEQAKADCAKPAARTSEVQTYELLDDTYVGDYSGRPVAGPPPDLPERVFLRHGSNTEFQPTRHAYRV